MSIIRGVNQPRSKSTIDSFRWSEKESGGGEREELMRDLKQLLKDNTLLKQENLKLKQQLMISKIEIENIKIKMDSLNSKQEVSDLSLSPIMNNFKDNLRKYQSVDLNQTPKFQGVKTWINNSQLDLCLQKPNKLNRLCSKGPNRMQQTKDKQNKGIAANASSLQTRKAKILAKYKPILQSEEDFDLSFKDLS